ncbi:hypothetical protein [Brumimicrobium mesophilum]|uniref:hypothetical protein n=1 Tax=Brumimicrobium mesophilum TaxID=392717 RepID=UPI000D144824|nr:hypothetical protein [Brumimicrobium mesophilum]
MKRNKIVKIYFILICVLHSCDFNDSDIKQNTNDNIRRDQDVKLGESDSILIEEKLLKLELGTLRIESFLESSTWEIIEICVSKDNVDCSEYKDSLTVYFRKGKLLNDKLEPICNYKLSQGGGKIIFEKCDLFNFEGLEYTNLNMSKGKDNFSLIYYPLDNDKVGISKISIKFIQKTGSVSKV